MTTTEGKPPEATQGLRELLEQAIKQGISDRVNNARSRHNCEPVQPKDLMGAFYRDEIKFHVEALLPALDSALGERQLGTGNLKTAQDVAYRIFAEMTVIPADAQAAKVIALISQAAAQARVDKWRPISEIHEDFGPCVLIDIDDPGHMGIGNNLDPDFDESGWTHFAEAPKLTSEEAERLKRERDLAAIPLPPDSPMQLLVNALRDPRWATESTEMAREIADRARKEVDAYLADPQIPAAIASAKERQKE